MPIHSSACSSFEADPELQPNSDHHYSDNSANSDRWSNTEEALLVDVRSACTRHLRQLSSICIRRTSNAQLLRTFKQPLRMEQ